jgi:hypothetical protein
MLRWRKRGRGRELVMRQDRLTDLRNDVPLIDLVSLPEFDARHFCCGGVSDGFANWPADAICSLRARIEKTALFPGGDAILFNACRE